jgi:hypothetical protein
MPDIKLTPKQSTTVNIEDWILVEDNSDPYKAPEQRGRQLMGRVYGHPKFEDGELVRTGELHTFDLTTRSASTKSNQYYLGAPKSEYAEVYPQAVEGREQENG